jgi:hypothetical protein
VRVGDLVIWHGLIGFIRAYEEAESCIVYFLRFKASHHICKDELRVINENR